MFWKVSELGAVRPTLARYYLVHSDKIRSTMASHHQKLWCRLSLSLTN